MARASARTTWIGRIILAVVLVVVGWLVYRGIRARMQPVNIKYMTETASIGDVSETIQSTGTLNAVTQVQVGAQVSGRIQKLYVDFNSSVKKGDLLAEIDPTIYITNVEASAAQYESALATLEGNRASLDLAHANFERAKGLHSQGIMSEADYLTAKSNVDLAAAQVHGAQASLQLAAASLRTSKSNLDFTKIYAPIDGVVILRSIDLGQTVAASFQTPVLFTIAQDLRDMLVLADIDEADIGSLSGAKSPDVLLQVEAFPADIFEGKLTEIRYNSTSNAGVVTYPAVISVKNPDVKLRPGMTATVTLHTASAKGVVRVPNAALRFRPRPATNKPVRPEAPPPAGKARIYLPPADPKDDPVAKLVDVGISDGQFTEVRGIESGTTVIIDEADAKAKVQRGLF